MLMKSRARQLATLLMLSSAWGLAFLPSTACAQSSATQSTNDDASNLENRASPSAEENSSADGDLSSEQSELDELVLGPWVKLAKVSAPLPKPEEMQSALKRCFTPPKFSEIKIDPGADRKLPDPTNLAGDMVYYRTDKGLQRFDFTKGFLVLLSEIKKVETEGRPITWAIRGTNLRFLIRFANAKKQGGSGQFMIENDNVYLRCPRPKKAPKTTGQ